MSLFVGFPEYFTSPKPVILTLSSPLQTTFASPEPAILVITSLLYTPLPKKSSEPVILTFELVVEPFNLIFSVPTRVLSIY